MANGQPETQRDDIRKEIAAEFQREFRSQANKKAAGWAIGAITGIVAIAAMGWWLYFEPKIRLYIASAAGGIPDGAVVAFAGKCPEDRGWIRYREASARVIIGAASKEELDMGPANLRNGDNGQPLTARAFGEARGTEMVQLTIDQIPAHSHWFFNPQGGHTAKAATFTLGRSDDPNAWFGYIAPRAGDAAGSFHRIDQKSQGGNQSHYNMPPYISLYFCKREARRAN